VLPIGTGPSVMFSGAIGLAAFAGFAGASPSYRNMTPCGNQ